VFAGAAVRIEQADINESDLGKPQFITTVIKPGVLGGGMWDPEPEDVRALPDKYEIPEPKPLDDGELWVREMKMKQKDEARARFAEEQANIGKNTLRPHSDIWSDVRINKRGEKLHWTDEEIEEFIGWYTFEPLQVRPLWQNYDYNMHLTPCVPETHVWMEEQGFRFYSEEDEMNLAEDSSLQTDFNDFDSMTTADVNAVDISDDDA
jgi:hypothetical protein